MMTHRNMRIISNREARRLLLYLQGLCGAPHLKQSTQALRSLILQMGFVQVDSIQWVERAHHMILFARNQTYRPIQLKNLIEKERFLFENWTHDASIIPSEFYPYWRIKFEREAPGLRKKFTNWQGDGFLGKCDGLVETIRTNGPLRSRDVERKKTGPQEMWQWHDGKAALEFLWRTGQLCISAREGFQKVYDLCERGLPAEHYSRTVSQDDFIDWACRSAIERLGFGSAGDISRFWNLVSIREANDWLEGEGKDCVCPVMVEGRKPGSAKQVYARADIESVLARLEEPPSRIRVLSPFDPVIRDRKRLEWLFDYFYRIEIYVPEAKRQWGYYVFPLLRGDRLIGRIDMRAKRKEGFLEIKALWLEQGVQNSVALRKSLDSELARQARLAGVKSVEWMCER